MTRTLHRLTALVALIVGVAFAFAVAPVPAAEYPSRAIHLVVPFKAGGGTDQIARGFAAAMETVIDQSVVVDNITGAGGVTGNLNVVRAKPDGYTVLLNGTADITGAMTFKELPFTLDDLIYVGAFFSSPTWILSHKNRGYTDLQSFLDKAKANPGKLTIGTAGPAGAQMIMASAIRGITGIDIRIIPYSGGKDLKKALFGNQVDMGIIHAPVALPAIKDGMLNVLGTGRSLEKLTYPPLRKTKTLTDFGIPIEIGITRGLYLPKGTPKDIVAKLAELTKKTAKSKAFAKFGNQYGFGPVWIDGPSFKKQIRAELALFKDIRKKYIGKK